MPNGNARNRDGAVPGTTGKTKEEIDRDLDNALADTFPASDPVAMEIPARRDPKKMHERSATATKMVREVVGVFDNVPDLEAAIDELQSAGFDGAELSMLATQDTVEEKLGHIYKKVSELEDDPDVPRKAYVSRESVGAGEGALIGGLMFVGAVAATGAVVATGGTLAAIIATAVASGGLGGLIGGILANYLDVYHADYLRHQIERGGLLLWVRVWDAEDEQIATSILAKHSAHDVHAHNLPAQL